MSYGLKRWGLGNGFGATLMASSWAYSLGQERTAIALLGICIMLFFIDHLVASRADSPT